MITIVWPQNLYYQNSFIKVKISSEISFRIGNRLPSLCNQLPESLWKWHIENFELMNQRHKFFLILICVINYKSHVINYQLSYPNFVWGWWFANIWILASRIELLNTNCRAFRKIFRCFRRKCANYSKGGQKGNFRGIFQPLSHLDNFMMK